MAIPYSGVSISGYNVNPPDDDGSETENNRITWAKSKDKLGDPLKNRTDSMDTALQAAFGKIDGTVTNTSISYDVIESDQGKLVRATSSGITVTTPDATDVGEPFVFAFLNDSTGDVTFEGFDTQTVDGLASFTVPAGNGFRVRTNGSNWFTEGRNFQRTQVKPQGYLTLLSVATSPTSPMPTSDQSAKTTVYYRPDGGNLVPVSDGISIAVREFSELSLALVSSHVANGIYDVFLFDDAGTLRIGTGPVWNTVTAGSGARGTGSGTSELDLLKGLLVNKVAATMRNGSTTYSVAAMAGVFLGSISIDGSAGQVTCHVSAGQSRKWGVSNSYNARTISLVASAPSDYTSNSTTGWRAANASTANSLQTFNCLPGDLVKVARNVDMYSSSGNSSPMVGIGYNSTSSPSGTVAGNLAGAGGSANVNNVSMHASLTKRSSIGINTITALEQGQASGTAQWLGGETFNSLVADWPA